MKSKYPYTLMNPYLRERLWVYRIFSFRNKSVEIFWALLLLGIKGL